MKGMSDDMQTKDAPLIHMPYNIIVASGTTKRDRWHVYRQVEPSSGYVDEGESLCGRHGLHNPHKPYIWSKAFAVLPSERGYCQKCVGKAMAESAQRTP